MEVKGTAFMSKRHQIVRAHGQARWDAFLERVRREQPFFAENVLATARIPVKTFLAFMDALLAEFFGGDERAYWDIGARSADWSLSEGPYRHFLAERDVKRFLAGQEALWGVHFTESTLKLTFDGQCVEAQASGLPVWHAYFEYMVMGFLQRAFDLAGWRTAVECLTPPRTRDFRYRFTLTAKEK